MSIETAASWGVLLQFGFAADSGIGNEVGIDKKICVGYKGILITKFITAEHKTRIAE